MSDNDYTPPKVWTWDKESGGQWASVNRPIAGPTHEQTLPVGDQPIQLYALGTPNGIKITVMLEELLALGETGAAYDLHIIDIGKGEQFGSDFVKLNPNSKIPVILDQSRSPSQNVWESCAILFYLAEKHDALLPRDAAERTECLSWLFWQESSASFLGGGFGHFYKYAPYPMEYPINRYAMETKRQLDVLDRHLAEREYICASGYSVADIAIWSWYGRLAMGKGYDGAAEFLDTASYRHVMRWAQVIRDRAAVESGLAVYR
ncbi:MAG: glutathione-dependent disulfide-bond oxidoreductase [Gammaproteobacteria bacterium]|nr:glutathione-dependent disulfide-bond oxidoreductase [Gammaproteobacteria bacterium]